MNTFVQRWILRMGWLASLTATLSALAVELPARLSTAVVPVRPKSLAVSALKALPPQVTLRLAAPDLSVVHAEDASNLQQNAKGRARVGIRRLLADPIRVLGSKTSWTPLPDGTRVWSARLESEEAWGVRVHLESIRWPTGVELRIFNAEDPTEIQGPFDATSLGESDNFWTPSLFGSAVVLECRVSPGSSLPSFRITELTHRYVRLGEDSNSKAGASTASPKTAASCNIDVTCEPAWAKTSHAVAGIGSVGVVGELFCSGCLLNDLNEAKNTDYFITAGHCITSQS